MITSRDGLVVGEGFHERAGGPHAEVVALRLAGEHASGGTAYVSLEPCNHFGRTPPCVDALLRARVGRVFVGMVDPDTRTAGKGIARLRDNGVDVTVGIEEELCLSANEGFTHRIRTGWPLGTWKYAMTLDGKIAADSGSSKWISGPDSRSAVQQLRSETDAIIVGGNTVRQDDPLLTVREKPPDSVQTVLQPYRVVFTRSLQLPGDARLWDTACAPTTVFTTPEAVKTQRDLAVHLRGVGVDVVEIQDLSPAKAMDRLVEMGALNVLWECGGRLAAEAVRDGCIQKVVAFVAPKLIGGSTYTPLHDIGLHDMGDALALEGIRVEQIGNDVMISGYLPRGYA